MMNPFLRGGHRLLTRRAKEVFLPWLRPLLPIRRPPNRYHNPRACLLIAGVGGAALYYYKHLETVPYTNRTRFVLYPHTAERDLFTLEDVQSIFEDDEDGDPLPSDHPDYVRVRRILDRIVDAARRSCGTSSILPDLFDWDAIVLRNDNKPEAMCGFGGKIIIYTGILQTLPTDAEIAWVIAHEVGHAISLHKHETLTYMFMFRIPYIVLLRRFRFLRLVLAEIVSRLLIHLPLSRRREMEADYIGLLLVALAGYDPSVVPKIFDRLGQKYRKEGMTMPDGSFTRYLAPHPTHNKRSQLVSQAMEEALAIYKKGIAVGNILTEN